MFVFEIKEYACKSCPDYVQVERGSSEDSKHRKTEPIWKIYIDIFPRLFREIGQRVIFQALMHPSLLK
jgi:hypothetical protein